MLLDGSASETALNHEGSGRVWTKSTAMSTKRTGRLLAAVVICLAMAAGVVTDAAAGAFKTVSIRGGDQGTLIIDIRNNQGAVVIREGSYAVATILATKKRWQRFVDAWHEVQAAVDEGRAPNVSVLKMGDGRRIDFEVGNNVKMTLIDETSSRTFTIYPEDYEVFTDAIERVLAHLED